MFLGNVGNCIQVRTALLPRGKTSTFLSTMIVCGQLYLFLKFAGEMLAILSTCLKPRHMSQSSGGRNIRTNCWGMLIVHCNTKRQLHETARWVNSSWTACQSHLLGDLNICSFPDTSPVSSGTAKSVTYYLTIPGISCPAACEKLFLINVN